MPAHTQASSLGGNTRAIYMYHIACTSALTLCPQLFQGTLGTCFNLLYVRGYPVESNLCVAIAMLRVNEGYMEVTGGVRVRVEVRVM